MGFGVLLKFCSSKSNGKEHGKLKEKLNSIDVERGPLQFISRA